MVSQCRGRGQITQRPGKNVSRLDLTVALEGYSWVEPGSSHRVDSRASIRLFRPVDAGQTIQLGTKSLGRMNRLVQACLLTEVWLWRLHLISVDLGALTGPGLRLMNKLGANSRATAKSRRVQPLERHLNTPTSPREKKTRNHQNLAKAW